MGEHDSQRAERLRTWFSRFLQYRGVDADLLGPVLDATAVGLVNSAWRNSVVEDWHAGTGPLSDADLMIINSHTTWRARQLLHRWRRDLLLAYDDPTSAIDTEADHFEWLVSRLYSWLANPRRRLPTGPMLSDIAGADMGEYDDHVRGVLGGWLAQADDLGVSGSLWRGALHGVLACPHWWGTPTWPQLVDDGVQVAFNPDDEYWKRYSFTLADMGHLPEQISRPKAMRAILLHRPWTLDGASARWIVHMGLGHLGRPVPPPTDLPDLEPVDLT